MTQAMRVEPQRIEPSSPERYINRELSWLAFNTRVMEEAYNTAHPLLERLKFLSISASNLDEFYMVRVAGLRGQVNAGVTTASDDGRTPAQALVAIHEKAHALMQDQQRCFTALLAELSAEIKTWRELAPHRCILDRFVLPRELP